MISTVLIYVIIHGLQIFKGFILRIVNQKISFSSAACSFWAVSLCQILCWAIYMNFHLIFSIAQYSPFIIISLFTKVNWGNTYQWNTNLSLGTLKPVPYMWIDYSLMVQKFWPMTLLCSKDIIKNTNNNSSYYSFIICHCVKSRIINQL